MSFIYKNPVSGTQLTGSNSVGREKVFGTNFSVLQTGGYMEVYTLNDLLYTIPAGQTGLIEFTGNTIPVNYSKRTLAFLPDTLTLNSDNISSGRRRLGMLVYVHETQTTYQYTMPNFEDLWNAASGSTTQSSFGTTVTTQSPGGVDFINAWLDSSIEGVSGVTRDEARWRIFYGTDWQITGGTYNSGTGTLSLDNNTGGTVNITGFTTGGGDTAISGITYDNNWGLSTESTDGSSGTVLLPFITGGTYVGSEINLNNALGNSISISAPESSDTFVTGGTITYNSNGDLDLSLNNSTVINIAGLSKITGATLVGSTLTLSDNLGNDIDVSGFTTTSSDTYVTGATYTESTGILSLERNDGNNVGVGGWSYVKSITESNNDLTVTLNNGNVSLLGIEAITSLGYNDWGITGSTTGGLFYNGTELPFITGGSYNAGTVTLNINGGVESNIQISGFDSDDTYLTGATYTPTTLTLGMNDGSEFNVGGFAPEITGGTYSNGTLSLDNNTGGSVDITGITFSSTNIYNTDGQLEGDRIIDQDSNNLTFSGGSVSMGTSTTSPVCALLELASTNQGLLIPRMTQVQRLAINSPLPGLLVYCTDSDGNGEEGMYMYKSQGWVNVL
jgi:hypothetical protein